MTPAVGQLSLAIAALFACGALGIGCLTIWPRTRETALGFWRLYADEFLIVVPIVVIAVADPSIGLILLCAFVLRVVLEIVRAWRTGEKGARPSLVLLSIWVAVFVWTGWDLLGSGLAVLFLLTYITIESADSLALLFGRLLGRTHPFPILSPQKTLAGCVAGLFGGGAIGTLLNWLVGGFEPPAAFMLSLTIVVVGLTGDLIVSMIKRGLAIKDFSPVLSRHGGAIDIYDSFVFALPAAAFVAGLLS